MEKICAKSISEKELASEIYRKAHTTQWQNKTKTKKQSIKKWEKSSNSHFLNDRHMKSQQWKNNQHHSESGKCTLKPQWVITSHC